MSNYNRLQGVKLYGDDVIRLNADWDTALAQTLVADLPGERILETLYKTQIEQSVQLKQVMQMHFLDVTHKGAETNYHILRKLVKTHMDAILMKLNKKGLQYEAEKQEAYTAKLREFAKGQGHASNHWQQQKKLPHH